MRAVLGSCVLLTLVGVVPLRAHANVVVRGTLTLPPPVKTVDHVTSFWPRQPNGIVTIAPPLVSPLSEALVVLEGPTGNTAGGGTVVMEIAGTDLSPRVLPV